MNIHLKNFLIVLGEISNWETKWPVGLAWYLPVFTTMSILGVAIPNLELQFMVLGAEIMPGYAIVPLLMLVPIKYVVKLRLFNEYGEQISRTYANKIIYSFTAELIGCVLAVMFALLALLAPAIIDDGFYWFVIIGGITIVPGYNILSKWHLGESFIVNWFERKIRKDDFFGAPFK